MPEYVNPNAYTVHLPGPDGKIVKVRGRQSIVLDEFFDRYRARGFIRLKTESSSVPATPNAKTDKARARIQVNRKQSTVPSNTTKSAAERARKRRKAVDKARKIVRKKVIQKNKPNSRRGKKFVVGRRLAIDATELLNKNLKEACYPISNNIGVGILSYNRPESLRRLIQSITKHTDLRCTTVFVSDDGSTNNELIKYLAELRKNPNITVLNNTQNVGIAGNSNRLIRCLSRFKYGLLLNDDVEILKPKWEYFYVEALQKTGMHHFQHRQPDVYNAKMGELINKNDVDLRVVNERPHGAILAFTRDVLVKCGYFDENYGQYGMEHIDWSMRPHEFGLQAEGFYDVEGSDDYFKVHADKSAVNDRTTELRESRKTFELRRPGVRVGPTEKSIVPELTYVVPFRNIEREHSILTVIKNIRAQRFPVIHTILVEQDTHTKINISNFEPIHYYIAAEAHNKLFNKSKAFNLGVASATSDRLILHDADMLVPGTYSAKVYETLSSWESCHLGGVVIYSSKDATNIINQTGIVETNSGCDRVVGYFEGGSIACTADAYWKVGGFNEDFWGYGCFTPYNFVMTNRGFIKIQNVVSSDRLLTHTGEYKKHVIRVRNYSGPILDIFIPGRLPIKGVTPEHPFLVRQDDGEFAWTKARDIRRGDELGQTDVFPDLSSSTTFAEIPDKSLNQFDVTSSYNLAFAVSSAMRRLGISHSFGKRKSGSDLCVNRGFEHLINSVDPKPDFKGSNSCGKPQFGLVYDIRIRYYSGLVYNFEVEDDKSYCVQGIIAHNCEDCDFYARLSAGSKWHENRVFDFLHLWHGRVSGWGDHHETNKQIECDLQQLSMADRIARQRKQLKNLGYDK